MDKESNRNTIIFMVCALVLVFGYETFVMGPAQKRQQAAAAAAAKLHPQAAVAGSGQAPQTVQPETRAISASPRVGIETPKLGGSIALLGARIDDLYLKNYHYGTDLKSPLVRLLRPDDSDHPWFAAFRWVGNNVKLPDSDTLWTAPAGAKLTPTTPLVLSYDNGQGLVFHQTIAVDSNYMFGIANSVTNTSGHPVSLSAYNAVVQRGAPADPAASTIVFEGAIGQLGNQLSLARYTCSFGMIGCTDWRKKDLIEQESTGGWMGLTQKYWLTALIPDQNQAIKAQFHTYADGDKPIFLADYTGPMQTIASGDTLTDASHFFAGAKVVPLLQDYGKSFGIPHFDNAVDWGIYGFFTHPLFIVLEWLTHHLGSVALGILALTVLLKAILFPLANKSYESITKMKKLQPQIEGLKKQYADDQPGLQQATMKLYQQEKINPLMGCLPMLVQIPVFFSLYKVLSVTIEMRQAPFYGWVHDLSARDPSTIWTLFGLIHWNPATAPFIGHTLDTSLHIGLWPMMYGFTMWLTQSMNPPAADPTQQRIFALMPLIFTFTLSQFTVGLLIYWTWSNLLSILQQYLIMHRYGVDNPIDNVIGRFIKPKLAV